MAVIAIASVIVAGCATTPAPHSDFYSPTMPIPDTTPPPADGAIYHADGNIQLFTDPVARQVGDILTIKFVVDMKGSMQASTSTKKSDSADLGGVEIAGRPIAQHGKNLFSAGFNGTRSFSGQGDSSASNSLQGSITVTVYRRLSNGNLIVRGEKWLSINKGTRYVQIYGIVRPQDIGPGNVVPSTKVANAHVFYGGEGVIDDANTMGSFVQFVNSPKTPY